MVRAQHPFYVKEWSDGGNRPKPQGHEDLGKNWVGAGHLKVGDKIKQADGTTGVVANVITLQQTREMFNLTVSEAHTYYVGQDGWLVHNAGPCGFADSFWKHIFSGHTTSRTATGAHVQNYSVEIDSWVLRPASDDAFGIARGGDIYVFDPKTREMVQKMSDTTMFPKNWTAPQIKQYIEAQLGNARAQVGTRDTFIATDRSNGVQMVYKVNPATGIVQSAYPRMMR